MTPSSYLGCDKKIYSIISILSPSGLVSSEGSKPPVNKTGPLSKVGGKSFLFVGNYTKLFRLRLRKIMDHTKILLFSYWKSFDHMLRQASQTTYCV